MKFNLILFFSFFSFILFAQPPNNDCSGLIDLGVVPFCDATQVFDNIGATAYDIGIDNEPGCFNGNPPSNDVWFQFQADNNIVDYVLTITGVEDNGNPLQNIQVALYRGFCAEDNLFLNACGIAPTTDNSLSIDLDGLTPGDFYFIRVDNFGSDQEEGEFHICIDEAPPIVNIDDGMTSLCEGTLFDSGGEDGNYDNNENYEFTICPDAPTKCLNLEFEYYNLEEGSEVLQFYNGPDTSYELIQSIGGGFQAGFGDGGVCYRVRADSCMTIVFKSNESLTFEGFKANWTCSSVPCTPFEPIVVTPGATYEQIEDIMETPYVDITIDTIICRDMSYGVFTDGLNTDLGIRQGLLLTTGGAEGAIGPNNDMGLTTEDDTQELGDADLDTLSNLFSNGSPTVDACIIEMDVVSYADEIEFEYIFGSEEYKEYVNTQFTDIFALLGSGPGVVGIPEINNQQNLAVLPSNGDFIEINSLNHNQNWEYYRNNESGRSIQYDGLTSDFYGVKKSLTAKLQTQPCSTYHLKFAIADRGDFFLDSGVFLSEIRSTAPEIITDFGSGLDYFVEKCTSPNQDSILIVLAEPNDLDVTYITGITGSATADVDYEFDFPSSITIPAGETTLGFPITVFDDSLIEGTETLIITFFQDLGCKTVEIATLNIDIKDQLEIEIEAEGDTLLVCQGAVVTLNVEGANSYQWSPFFYFDDPFVKNPTLNSNAEEGWIFVEGTIDPFTISQCGDKDSVYIKLIDPMIEIIGPDDLGFCTGDTITLMAQNNLNDKGISWGLSDPGVISPNEALTEVALNTTGLPQTFMYIAEARVGQCLERDTIEVAVDPIIIPTPFFTDTTVCEQEMLTFINNTLPAVGQISTWTPDEVMNNGGVTIPSFTFATNSQVYILDLESINGYCKEQLTFDVTVLPNSLEILPSDTINICLGDSIDITALPSPPNADILWTSEADIIDPTANTIRVSPITNTTFYITHSTVACSGMDSIVVLVDSLPIMDIDVIPLKDPYCNGDIVTFVSPGYNVSNYPNIEHMWSPGTGVENELTDYNLAITATETTSYIRTTTNGGCSEMDTVDIRVVDPSLQITVGDTTVCPFTMIQLGYTSDSPLTDITWTPEENLSCTECDDPILTVNDMPITVTVTGEEEGCPAEASILVDLFQSHELIVSETILCGSYADIIITNNDDITNINWTTDASTPFDCVGCKDQSIQVLDEEITVTVTFDSGECEWELSKTITRLEYGGDASIIEPPSNPCKDDDQGYFISDQITLVANINFPPIEGTVIQWYQDGVLLPGVTGLEAPYTIEADLSSVNNNTCRTINLSWAFTDIFGCEGEGGINILVGRRFETPNAFSPGNNDGVNDVFRLVDKSELEADILINQFTVYNRWGQLMFECEDLDCALETGWDGTFKSVKQPSDTYMYYIEIEYPSGFQESFKGDLLLIK